MCFSPLYSPNMDCIFQQMQLTQISSDRLLSDEFMALLKSYQETYQPINSTYLTSHIPESKVADFLNNISEEQCHLLLLGNIWIINYNLYGHLQCNFDLICQGYQTVLFVTRDTSSDLLCGLRSGTATRVASKLNLRVDFYNNASVQCKINIPEMFVSHFIHQMECTIGLVGKGLDKEVSLACLCYGEESMNKLRSFMKVARLPLVAEEYNQFYCVELSL